MKHLQLRRDFLRGRAHEVALHGIHRHTITAWETSKLS